MVSETVLVAAVSGGLGLSGSLIVALVSVHRTRLEQQSEDQRLYAEFLLQRKIAALEELYEDMEECYLAVQQSKTSRRSDDVVPAAVSTFQSTVSQNYIWMSDKQREALEAVAEQFDVVQKELHRTYPQRSGDGWQQPYQAQIEHETLQAEMETLEERIDGARNQLQIALEQPIQELVPEDK